MKGFSRTSLGAASMRIFHQLHGDRTIFEDAMTPALVSEAELDELRGRRARLLSEEDRAALAGMGSREEGDAFCNLALPFSGSMLLGFRLTDDLVEELAGAGGGQVVILGAGLDCTAPRFAKKHPGITFYEVDAPVTQTEKKRRLAEAGFATLSNIVFTPVDFEEQSLEEALLTAGFESGRRSVFSWLNVTCYLSWSAMEATLRAVRGLSRGGGVLLFDIYHPDSAGAAGQLESDRLRGVTQEGGEPIIGLFDPDAVETLLEELGYQEILISTGEGMGDLQARFEAAGYRFSPASYLIRAVL